MLSTRIRGCPSITGTREAEKTRGAVSQAFQLHVNRHTGELYTQTSLLSTLGDTRFNCNRIAVSFRAAGQRQRHPDDDHLALKTEPTLHTAHLNLTLSPYR
jgi:hypothetical protein